MNNNLQPFDPSQFYAVRMHILMEDEPQSNKYRRVLLNAKQYKMMSDALHNCFPKDPKHNCGNKECDGTVLQISDHIIPMPDMQDIHTCTTKKCKC